MMAQKDWRAWLLTASVAAGAAIMAWILYEEGRHDPWTRDGQVAADILLVTAPASGVLEKVNVRPNTLVRKGELLFSLESGPLAAEQAAAETELELSRARLALLETERHAHLYGKGCSEASSVQGAAHTCSGVALLGSRIREARARVERDERVWRSLMERREKKAVYAPAEAYVMPCSLQKGGSVEAGERLFALAVKDSFHVTGFFRETVIRHIVEGNRAEVTLVAYPDTVLQGAVESVGRGIARKNGTLDEELLPEVTPAFDWVRLAQRIPVRIRLDAVPAGVELRVGLTASVKILSGGGSTDAPTGQNTGRTTPRQAE